MKNLLLACVVATLLICPCATAHSAPAVAELQLVAQLPAELPQRIEGLTYDGKKLWVSIYMGRGHYATLDPTTLLWTISRDEKQRAAIAKVSGLYNSASGFCFANGKLWVAGSYGESFGSIDTGNWQVDRVFKGKQQPFDQASQTYSSMAWDGSNLWVAWHWFRYDLPTSETQLLLKVDPETGNVVAQYPAPAGSRADMTHGLTWDGSKLWHIKDNKLSAIDTASGKVIDQYTLPEINRGTGLAWDGRVMWISEFDGKIWRLPF
jgi:hypothetical protein